MNHLKRLKSHASGRWREILLNLAPHISPMIERGRRHGPCALCGGKDRARCHDDFNETGGMFCNQCAGGSDGLAVLQWANDWSFQQAMDALKSHLGLADGQLPSLTLRPKPELVPIKDWENERRRLKAIWDATEPDSGRIKKYLDSRGLTVEVPPTLRLHPSLGSYNEGLEGYFQAMVARIQRDGETIGLHFTYLDVGDHGKAPISRPKKIRKCVDNISGGAIQLFEPQPGEALALSEGIETALSVMEMTGYAVWCCMNAAMLEKIIIPDSVSDVVICGDLDKENRGQQATERLAERLYREGKTVNIALPPGPIPTGLKGIDWLDVLVKDGEVAYV